MCDPFTIAGAALSIGGIAANQIASNQVDRANGRVLRAERARQAQLRNEAAQIQEQSRERYNGFEGQQDNRAAELGAYLRNQAVPAQAGPESVEAPATESNITTQAETAARGARSARSAQSAEALAGMRSFGDVLGGISRLQGRDAGQIGQIGGFMRGSSGVVPLELDAAGRAGDGMRTLGTLASGLGNIGVSAGLSGFGSAAGAAEAATGAATSGLPTLASMPGAGSSSLAGALAARPMAPMNIGMPAGPRASFTRPGNMYSIF